MRQVSRDGGVTAAQVYCVVMTRQASSMVVTKPRVLKGQICVVGGGAGGTAVVGGRDINRCVGGSRQDRCNGYSYRYIVWSTIHLEEPTSAVTNSERLEDL